MRWRCSRAQESGAKRVTITAIAAYTQWDVDASGDPETSVNGRKLEVFPSKELTARVTLTNGVSGRYSTMAASVAGEAIPTGLAQSIWTSLNRMQYDGTVQIVEQECSGSVGMGNVLNLTGGRSEWTSMRALVQGVRKRYGTGQTQVTVGPARHLSAGDLTALFLINRNRRVWVNPNLQATAQLTSQGPVALGGSVARENTQMGLEERSLLVTAASAGGSNKTEIVKDAENQKVVMAVVDSAGSQVSGTSGVSMTLPDLSVGGAARQASFRWFYFKDAKNSCAAMKCLVLMTSPEADS